MSSFDRAIYKEMNSLTSIPSIFKYLKAISFHSLLSSFHASSWWTKTFFFPRSPKWKIIICFQTPFHTSTQGKEKQTKHHQCRSLVF